MRKKIVAGNWKMNGRLTSIKILLTELKQHLSTVTAKCEVIIFPPAIYLPLVSEALNKTAVKWGAQNIYPQAQGAFTGEISVAMLQDYQCEYVLVGHSERRKLFNESEKFAAEKFHQVKEHGMIPILCVGETLEERNQELTEQVLRNQLQAAAAVKADFSNSVIAYEPVWAIGTGLTASPEQAQATHELIRKIIADVDAVNANTISILYGGSVNESNARALFSMPDVDGGLIGGASLEAQKFVEIIKCIN